MKNNTYVENAWFVAGRSQEFPVDQPKGCKIAGKPVLVWRTRSGEVCSFDDRCVHKRMPLSEGRVLEDGVLECPYHGFCYDAAGNCQRIPSQLDMPVPTKAKLRSIQVWLAMSSRHVLQRLRVRIGIRTCSSHCT